MDFLPAKRPSIRALFISTNCLDNRAFPDLVHTAAASNTYNFIEFFMLSMKHYSLIIKIPTIFKNFTKKNLFEMQSCSSVRKSHLFFLR